MDLASEKSEAMASGLLKKYAEGPQKRLPGKFVRKFVQVELQLQRLTDLQVAGQLPNLG